MEEKIIDESYRHPEYGGEVEFNGDTYLLTQEPYINGGGYNGGVHYDSPVHYAACAVRLGDKIDENNEAPIYDMTWKLNPDYDPAQQEEADACDWEHPATVEFIGKTYIEPHETKEKQDVFPVPGKENRAITVWVEEGRDGQPHWYDFTEEEARKVDFDKAFPHGYVDYFIDIDKDGIISSDTLSPDKVGTHFQEAYPNFKCKDNLYEEQENLAKSMEAVEDAIQDALDALEVPAAICIECRESDEPYFSFKINGIQKDEVHELSSELDTLSAVSHEMELMAIDYDVNEERELWVPGENGAPVEPYLTDEFRYIQKVYQQISDACKAAERIQQGEKASDVYHEYQEAWNKEDWRACKRECGTFLYRMGNLYSQISEKDTMGLMNLAYAERQNGRSDMKPRDVETMKVDLMQGIQSLAQAYQHAYDIPQKDIEKALKRACKELPNLQQEKQASR